MLTFLHFGNILKLKKSIWLPITALRFVTLCVMYHQSEPVFLFTLLGMGAGPLQWGKITREMPKLGKSCGVKFFK